MSGESTKYKNKLDVLFGKVNEIQDIELQSEWAKYLCIRVSGYLELSIRTIYTEYAHKKAHKNVANFVSSRLGGFQNPNMELIFQRSGAFNSNWRKELESIDDELQESVNSIVNLRNAIAHGNDVGLTYKRIKEHYENAIKVLQIMENQCNRG
jgi:hypothetical protein